jgi:lysophospholipase L1-like esterase
LPVFFNLAGVTQKGNAKAGKYTGVLPETISTTHVVSSKGYTVTNDHLHFDAAGYREFGKRYAARVLPLLGYKMREEK